MDARSAQLAATNVKQKVRLRTLNCRKRNVHRRGAVVDEHPLVLVIPDEGDVVACAKRTLVYCNGLERVGHAEFGAVEYVLKKQMLRDLALSPSAVLTKAFDVK